MRRLERAAYAYACDNVRVRDDRASKRKLLTMYMDKWSRFAKRSPVPYSGTSCRAPPEGGSAEVELAHPSCLELAGCTQARLVVISRQA